MKKNNKLINMRALFKEITRNFERVGVSSKNGKKILLSSLYPAYDWVNNNGYKNMGDWIEEATKKANK